MIPKHAKKVFVGTVFDIYQWKQKMFNATTRTFEAAKRMDGVCIVATVKNKIVLLWQKQPGTNWYYTLPGGYMDPGETPKQAALRELLEETGLKPKRIKLWKTFRGTTRIDSKFYVFIAQGCEKVGEQNLDGGEIIEIQLKSFEQFLKYSDHPKFYNRDVIIEMLRARLSIKSKQALKGLLFG